MAGGGATGSTKEDSTGGVPSDEQACEGVPFRTGLWRPTTIRSMHTLSTGYQRPQPWISTTNAFARGSQMLVWCDPRRLVRQRAITDRRTGGRVAGAFHHRKASEQRQAEVRRPRQTRASFIAAIPAAADGSAREGCFFAHDSPAKKHPSFLLYASFFCRSCPFVRNPRRRLSRGPGMREGR